MTESLVGTGGWAYFRIRGRGSLALYSKAFDFVEINSTFYEIPSLSLVRSWRRRVPPDFQFSVRCNRDITHKHMLEPTDEALALYRLMVEICGILKAPVLHVQTSSRMVLNDQKIRSMNDFFCSSPSDGPRVALELRGGQPPSKRTTRLMQDLNMIHCVDLSVQQPAFDSDIIYARLFGSGRGNIYQFTDDELTKIDERSIAPDLETSILAFHGVKMYKDAARFKTYKETGAFPAVTSHTGLQSLKEVLEEDARFPCSKEDLVEDQGWKVIDLTKDSRIHASTVLDHLPERTFESVDDVVTSLSEVCDEFSF